jgi:hypothetical protein
MIVLDRIRARRASWRSRRNAQRLQALSVRQGDGLASATQSDEPDDAGMTTAEYAIGTLAACALATVRRSTR